MNENLNYIVIIAIVIATVGFLIFKEKREAKRTSGARISSENVPANLSALVPLLEKWGIADDNKREQLIKKLGTRQKRDLIDTVYPLMHDINKFLDSFNDKPMSEEAILIGNLAELVSELKIEVDYEKL